MIAHQTDRFLSEEDLDLQNLTWDELVAWWNLWLEQSQITNGMDRDEYSHGVFRYGSPAEGGGRITDDGLPSVAPGAKVGRRMKPTPNPSADGSNAQ